MRMKLRLSGRPSAVKYSALPLRSKRKPECSLPPTVKVAACTGPVPISSPSRQIWSTTTLKRSLAPTSSLKSMSYLKISSVSVLMLLPDRPCLRAERNSERPTSPLSTTVRVSVGRSITCLLDVVAAQRHLDAMGRRRGRSAACAAAPSTGRSKPSTVPGLSRVSDVLRAGLRRARRCMVAAGMSSCVEQRPQRLPATAPSPAASCRLLWPRSCASGKAGSASASVVARAGDACMRWHPCGREAGDDRGDQRAQGREQAGVRPMAAGPAAIEGRRRGAWPAPSGAARLRVGSPGGRAGCCCFRCGSLRIDSSGLPGPV